MSFSKAPLKRFNDHVGCAPPPGTYDPKHEERKGAASFDKSEPAHAFLLPPSPSRAPCMSPIRRTMSADGLADGGSAKKEKTAMSIDMKQQKLLEKEILGAAAGEQDRRLQALQDDLKKAEAKLLAAVREKTTLTANVTSLERQRAELKKINEFLKNKVSADASKKRINSLTMDLMEARNNLDAKNRELNVLRVSTEGQVKALEMDIKEANDNLMALTERNKDLVEDAKHRTEIREKQEEVRVLADYLDSANEKIQLRVPITMSLTRTMALVCVHCRQHQSDIERQMARLEDELRQKEEETQAYRQDFDLSKQVLRETEMRLESQELELETSKESVKHLENQMKSVNEELQAAHTTVHQQEAELSRVREVLRRTEKELDERVAHLEQRCHLAEEDRSMTRTEGLNRAEELKAEINALTEAKKEEENKQIQLQEEHSAITEELTKEKVTCLHLTVNGEREESEQKMGQLKEELEEVLGELAVLEGEEQRRRELLTQNREEMEKLQTENMGLEKQLNDTLEQLLGCAQLNAFAAEKNALLNEKGANQEELNKLSDAYARLMGHQNQKQKIKHIVKLKDENLTLKQELSKLRTQVFCQKREMEQLKLQLPGSTRRFDPTKAFQHDKENMELFCGSFYPQSRVC
uniref:Hyaluronan-mediated motility receptor (RHAMM) n=1 Tax=Neogobius melanostomus TaxID=47308 RepID=A0A8C6TJ47_9GOBI